MRDSKKKKVGVSFQPTNEDASYWDTRAKGYRSEAYDKDLTASEIRRRILVDYLSGLKRGKLLDAGCGCGAVIESCFSLGFDSYGVDVSGEMISVAKETLKDKGIDNKLYIASVTDLNFFEKESFDVIVSLGVMQYIVEDQLAYKEINRILKLDGYFISSHQNELFDLFTFNKYTMKFFANNVLPFSELKEEKYQDVLDQISALITNPQAPLRHGKGSARDEVYSKAENPLVFDEKLEKYGFSVIRDYDFYNIHLVPPLILNDYPDLKEKGKESEISLKNRWQAFFMASQFLAYAQKVSDVQD